MRATWIAIAVSLTIGCDQEGTVAPWEDATEDASAAAVATRGPIVARDARSASQDAGEMQPVTNQPEDTSGDQMANLLPPEQVFPPKGCPPAVPDSHGIGKACTDGGGECEGAGDIPLHCTCDSLDYRTYDAGVLAPVLGTPCMCVGHVSGGMPEPMPGWYCPGPAPDHILSAAGYPGTATLSYTLSPWPDLWMTVCAPAACAGINLSR